MKKVLKILVGFLELVIIIYAVFVIMIMLSYNKYGYTEIGDNTYVSVVDENKSELGKFEVGDLISIKKTTYDKTNIGDSLFYYATADNQYIIVQDTVVEKEGSNREAVYKFEHNSNIIPGERIVGVLDKTYDNKGKLYEVLTSTVGFLLLVILPVLVIFIYQVYKFILLIKEDKVLTEEEERQSKSPIKLKPRQK